MTQPIDCHAHVYLKTLQFTSTAWHRPDEDASYQEFAATLQVHGVGGAVLAAASTLADENEYALEAVKANSGWRTTVVAPPGIKRERLDAWKRQGAVGIRLQCMHHPLLDFQSEDYHRLFRAVADMGWHIQVHDHGYRLAETLPLLMATGARIVVDHFGRPNPATGRDGPGYQAMLKAAETGRLWVKLSAGFRLHSPEFASAMAGALLADLGPDRLVWGSDWPFAGFEGGVTYAQARSTFEQWVPAGARERVGRRTPQTLYYGGSVSAAEIDTGAF